MLKSIVNGVEYDIISIPMKGKNLLDYKTVVNGPYATAAQISGGISVSGLHYVSFRTVQFAVGNAYTMSWKAATISGTSAPSWRLHYSDNTYSLNQQSGWTLIAEKEVSELLLYVSMSEHCVVEFTEIMLNADSTALPYEPYGYQNGWEIRDDQNNIVWGREDTITGTPPFYLRTYGLPINTWELYGNSYQSTALTPDNPVMPEFVGVRTGNLFDITTLENGIYLAASGNKYGNATNGVRAGVKIKAFPNTAYTLSVQSSAKVSLRIFEWSNGTFAKQTPKYNVSGNVSLTVTTDAETTEIAFNIEGENGQYAINIMLNSGSTALPYEPYGWKIPFENNGENLFDASLLQNNMHLDTTTGLPVSYTGRIASPTPVDVSQYQSVTISYVTATSNKAMYSIFSNNELVERITAVSSDTIIDVSNADKMYICFYSTNGDNINTSSVSDIMLNSGNTARPYSSYFSETIPVYLGQTQTVRRIKKLVLDGTENWNNDFGQSLFGSQNLLNSAPFIVGITAYSTHFKYNPVQSGLDNAMSNGEFALQKSITAFNLFFKNTAFSSTADFKAWLSAQYAAGTPVTVWYILASEQTGIVNEPLCKIGDYADELSSTNSAISIPTTDGINTLDVNTNLKPSYISLTGHIKTMVWYILKDVDGYILKDVDGYILNVKE